MGRMVEEAAARDGAEIICVIDPLASSRGKLEDADVAIDFSEPGAVVDNVRAVAAARVSMVVGTTGWYDRVDEVRSIVDESGIGFVYGSNFSIGYPSNFSQGSGSAGGVKSSVMFSGAAASLRGVPKIRASRARTRARP